MTYNVDASGLVTLTKPPVSPSERLAQIVQRQRLAEAASKAAEAAKQAS